MQSHKMLLEVEDEVFHLVAIYSSLEVYKMAYSLNKYLKIKLKQERDDIDFKFMDYLAVYPNYSYNDPNDCFTYNLVGNKFKVEIQQVDYSGSLFGEKEMRSQDIYLIPEYKKVDFFLKISEEIDHKQFIRMVTRINQIPGVQAAHAVDIDLLKSKKNLIFE